MFVFGGVNILQLKKKNNPANMILIMNQDKNFLLQPPPINDFFAWTPKKTAHHVVVVPGRGGNRVPEPPYFGIRVDETRAVGNNTSKRSKGQGKTVTGEGDIRLSRGLLGCPGTEVRINGDRINGLFHLLLNGMYWGEITHLLTVY